MAEEHKRYYVELNGRIIEVFPSEGLNSNNKVVINKKGELVFITIMGEIKIIGSNEHIGFVTSYT